MSELKVLTDAERDAILHRHDRQCPPMVSGPDVVNHPPHYTQGGIECIDAIRAALTEEEFRGYCKGNALKYIWRERHKGGTESMRKANWYINKITEVENGCTQTKRNGTDQAETEEVRRSGCNCKGH